MRDCLSFEVYGVAKPKGSLRHVGGGRLIEAVDNRGWRVLVITAALQAARRANPPFQTIDDGPVAVDMTVTVARPKSTKLSVRCPVTRSSGDLDKHARLILDSLTDAQMIRDDSQVVELHARKTYIGAHPKALRKPGVRVTVWALAQLNDKEDEH